MKCRPPPTSRPSFTPASTDLLAPGAIASLLLHTCQEAHTKDKMNEWSSNATNSRFVRTHLVCHYVPPMRRGAAAADGGRAAGRPWSIGQPSTSLVKRRSSGHLSTSTSRSSLFHWFWPPSTTCGGWTGGGQTWLRAEDIKSAVAMQAGSQGKPPWVTK